MLNLIAAIIILAPNTAGGIAANVVAGYEAQTQAQVSPAPENATTAPVDTPAGISESTEKEQ